MLTFKYQILYFTFISAIYGNTYNARISFYYGTTTDFYTSYDLSEAEHIADAPNFDFTKSTAIFIHGWQQSPYKALVQNLINAYIENGNYNILILDWSEAADSSYLTPVMLKVPGLGVDVALFLNRLNKKGVGYSTVHMVGFSLGAYVASSAGKYTTWNYGRYIGRITGLDPANFYQPLLEANDADFVDIIHTSPGVMGTPLNSGTVDFWPNKNSLVQPGCPLMPLSMFDFACSHRRALDLFSESVKNNNDYNFISSNINNPFDVVQMGNNCPTSAAGVYQFSVNEHPFEQSDDPPIGRSLLDIFRHIFYT